MPTIVFGTFRAELEHAELAMRAAGYETWMIRGGISDSARENAIRESREAADMDGQSVLCLERVEPALPGRGITGPLEHPDPDRLEPAAGHVLLGVLRSHPQGRQRRPDDHPMPRQGMDEGLQFRVARYTHGISVALKSKYMQDAGDPGPAGSYQSGRPKSGTESGTVSARREPHRLAPGKRNGRATRFRD